VSQSVAMDYRAIVTCANTSSSDVTAPYTVAAGNPCYCAAIPNYDYYHDIVNVSVGTVANPSNCGTTGGPGSILNRYSDYTTVVPPIVLAKGQSYPLSVSVVGNCGTASTTIGAGVTVFIDYNGDGTYSAAERVYSSANVVPPFTVSSSFTVPATAATWIMRAVARRTGAWRR